VSLPTRIGRYEIVEMVGRGGMGAVYRGRDSVLDRDVAIKMMSAEYVEDEERRARFYREARAAAKLQHRNIITVFEFGEHDGHPYMVMEFLRGMDLQRRMRTPPPIPLDQKLDFAIGLLLGLGLAHQNGVIHRDVKPANVWVLEDGTVKLLDFGIAKLGATSSTRHAGVMGTVAYMSPEQVSGRVLDGRSDVFSAGVVLYELLSGRKPFDGETVTEVMVGIIERQPPPIPDLPQAIRAVLERALEKNTETRYQTAFDFAADLQLLRARLRPDSGPFGKLDLPLTMTTVTETLVGTPPPVGTSSELPLHRPPTGGQPGVDDAGPAPAHRPSIWIWLIVAAIVVASGTGAWLYTRATSQQKAVAPIEAPPPEPAPVRVPTVLVTTTPPGAAVELNGVRLPGRTPLSIELGASTPHRLALTLAGHQVKELVLTEEQIAAGEVAWQFVLVPADTTLQVTADYGFELLRQGRPVDAAATSHTVRVRASETLQARAPALFLDRLITIPDKPPSVVRVTLPALGKLSVRTNLETCEVTINGRSAGFPPVTEQEIVSGSHILALKCPDGPGPRQAVTIPAGGTLVALCQASGCQVQIR
jgi:tRNA A-37 threonylcarbamoyl transferase component Bud32